MYSLEEQETTSRFRLKRNSRKMIDIKEELPVALKFNMLLEIMKESRRMKWLEPKQNDTNAKDDQEVSKVRAPKVTDRIPIVHDWRKLEVSC